MRLIQILIQRQGASALSFHLLVEPCRLFAFPVTTEASRANFTPRVNFPDCRRCSFVLVCVIMVFIDCLALQLAEEVAAHFHAPSFCFGLVTCVYRSRFSLARLLICKQRPKSSLARVITPVWTQPRRYVDLIRCTYVDEHGGC